MKSFRGRKRETLLITIGADSSTQISYDTGSSLEDPDNFSHGIFRMQFLCRARRGRGERGKEEGRRDCPLFLNANP